MSDKEFPMTKVGRLCTDYGDGAGWDRGLRGAGFPGEAFFPVAGAGFGAAVEDDEEGIGTGGDSIAISCGLFETLHDRCFEAVLGVDEFDFDDRPGITKLDGKIDPAATGGVFTVDAATTVGNAL